MPLVNESTERIEVGSDWYEIRCFLGWYDWQRVDEARKSIVLPLLQGRLVRDGQVEVRIREVDFNLMRLRVRIRRWSHNEGITDENLRRLPPDHARALLNRINELEQAESKLFLDPEGKESSGGT